MRIIRDPRDISPDRDALVREAALKPVLHREIVTKYGGMPPSDEALKAFLLIDRGLKDEAVPEFMREFTATMAFAKIAESGIIQEVDEAVEAAAPDYGEPDQPSGIAPIVREAVGSTRKVVGPMEGERELTTGMLSREANFRLIVSGPIGVKEIDLLIRKLELDKEILADEPLHPSAYAQGGEPNR